MLSLAQARRAPGEDMELWQLMAREAIRDLVARYNANGDTGRFDQVLELFAPDAVLQLDDRRLTGPEEIRSVFTGTRARTRSSQLRPAYVRHITGTHQIDLIDESRAEGRCYFVVMTRIGLDHWGRYVDGYRTVDGSWRFSHRRVTVDGYARESLFKGSD
jgi:ketosteroid isomerase-like protein